MNEDFVLKSKSLITLHEGRKAYLYNDTKGLLTGGVGHLFTGQKLSDKIIDMLLEEDWQKAYNGALSIFPYLLSFSSARKAAIVDMVFNLGVAGVKDFKTTIRHINNEDWNLAGDAMLDSLWSKQVGKRAVTLSKMIKTGEWPNVKVSS